MNINIFIPQASGGHDDTDDGIYAEETRLLWGYITKSSILIEYGDHSFAIYAPSKGAAYIARKQFYRKAKRAGFHKLNPDNVYIGVLPDKDICNHPEFRGF